MSSSSDEVIWERQNKAKKWCPYSAVVSQLIEQANRRNLTSVWLGDGDSSLKLYTVNLKDLIQTSEATGTKCPVRRHVVVSKMAQSSTNQASWEWCGDSKRSWRCYTPDINAVIENSYLAGDSTIDLNGRFPGYNYTMDFAKMLQINNISGYHRAIKRNNDSGLQLPPISFNANAACGDSALNGVSEEPKGKKPSKKKNRALSKKVNKILKKMSAGKSNSSGEDDDANDDDGASSESLNKKLCSSAEASSSSYAGQDLVPQTSSMPSYNNVGIPVAQSQNDQTADNVTYALVHGKPWRNAWPPHTAHSDLKPVPGIDPLPTQSAKKGRKKKGAKGAIAKSEPALEVDVFGEFTEVMTDLPPTNEEEEVCIICYENLRNGSSYDDDSTLLRLKLCSHIFHKSCLKAMYESGSKDSHLQCPTCKAIHGVKFGTQPPGTMTYHVLPYSLPGYPDRDTIQIIYDIKPGTQGPEHPHPGKKYNARGFPRYCYLPDNEIGRMVLRLLIKAWERRLIFTVGTSTTTGEADTVTWNEIHHKTEFGFNRNGHGYPDPAYFENVVAELAAHGVTDNTPSR